MEISEKTLPVGQQIPTLNMFLMVKANPKSDARGGILVTCSI